MPTKPSRILVTGGTGFLGAHVVDLLLERGIVVVVTARSESKAKDFAETRSRFKDLLEVVVTGDLTAVGAFDVLARDFDVIIHCASPLPNGLSPGSTISKTIIEPAISGTLSILQAARKNPTLKRLVFTSTVGAVLDITKEPTPGPVGDSYTADDWNPVTYEEGAGSDHPPFAYRVGKKFAELEAWAGVDPTSKHLRQLELDPRYPGRKLNTTTTPDPSAPTEQVTPPFSATPSPTTTSKLNNVPTFDLTVICPPLVLGPWVHPLGPSGLDSLNYSNSQIRGIVRGEYRDSRLPRPLAPLWVDVRDAALAHVEAALRLDSTHGALSNGRYIICSPKKFNYHMVGEIIREEFPEWAEQVLPPKEEIPPFVNISLDGTLVTRDLGVAYRSFRECVVDLVRQLREEILREAEASRS